MDNISAVLLVSALFIIMTGMGLSLTIADFKRVLKYPLAVFAGFFNQIILLPLIAYGLIIFLKADPEIAIGLMILAACPGGSTSNLITHLSKGDTALSVTLTAINSLITIVTIPLIINFSLNEFSLASTVIEAPIDKIIGSLIVVIALPLSIGMAIKKFAGNIAEKMDRPVKIASAIVLTLVIAGLLIKEKDQIANYFEQALVITLALNVTTMLFGYIISRFVGLDFKQSLTISIESGSQNGTLAIQLAVVSLASPQFAIVAAVYSLIMYPTALVPIFLGNKRSKSLQN